MSDDLVPLLYLLLAIVVGLVMYNIGKRLDQ